MMREHQPVLDARQLILALVLAVPLALAQPALSQPGEMDAVVPADLIDPDCYPKQARRLETSLLEEPDGVCSHYEPQPPAEPRSSQQHGPAAPGDPSSPRRPGRGSRGSDDSNRPRRGGKQQRRKGQGNKSRPKKHKSRKPAGGAKGEPRDGASPKRRRSKRRHRGDATNSQHPQVWAPAPSRARSDPLERESAVPGFLRRIYLAAGARYRVRWEILAAINKVETDYGRNLNVSWAGAIGWMQFMPATWRAYGTDGNRDGVENPYNPTDAIFSAARYLSAAGYEDDPRAAIFAYNHADWYVELVLEHARAIASDHLSLPAAKRLDRAFASRLTSVAELAGVDWELILAVIRVRGSDGSDPASRARLRTTARRLVELGARRHPRRAMRRLARARPSNDELRPRLLPREAGFAERVMALAHYNEAIGIKGLRRGLKAVKPRLARQVLQSPGLEIYPGGRADVQNGVTSVRVLALLAYLSSRYEQVTVTSLTSGHSFLTASGNVSAHSYGRAVDIAALNGTPVLGHQHAGGPTERALWKLLLLPDELAPSEVISLFELGGPSFALDDHDDHIHVGF
jgi:hypothetical protein